MMICGRPSSLGDRPPYFASFPVTFTFAPVHFFAASPSKALSIAARLFSKTAPSSSLSANSMFITLPVELHSAFLIVPVTTTSLSIAAARAALSVALTSTGLAASSARAVKQNNANAAIAIHVRIVAPPRVGRSVARQLL